MLALAASMDGNTQSNDERGAEKVMDAYLKSIGLHRKKIAKDGSCLFRAVAEQVLHCQSLHTKVRARCVEFLRKNRELYEAFIEGDFEEYLLKLQDPQQWVGEVEINALAVMYKRDFLIFQEPGKPAVNITDKNFKEEVRLCFLNGNHYDSVYPVGRIKNAALCQSVLYELLYDDVFKVDRGVLGPAQRFRPSDFLSDDNMAACGSSDESDLDSGEPLWIESEATTNRHSRGRGRGRLLPERVRRSLNPALLRNIEYDVWNKTKAAQQKRDYCMAAGLQFTVGDRCQVRLEGSGRSYNATVKEAPPNDGLVTVYIEELGKKQVPLWCLRPPCDESSWSTVVSRDKRLSNGHGESRGRAKSSPVSAAPGPGGRVLKQHSWPPQAPAEANRKSAAEAAFGLTEQQRLAREEEERNVALVEIQLRDELSFPALGGQAGTAGDGGRKRGGGGGGGGGGGDGRRLQRNKTKSPEEDARAPSPSAGGRPKSSTPPLPDAPTVAKTNAPPCAAAAAPASPPAAAAAPSSRPSAAGGAAAPSATLFPFLTPALPAASSTATSSSSSSSPPPSSSSQLLTSSSSSSSPPSSLPPPTFIAPIAPSPAAAQGFLPRSSPPVSSLPRLPSPLSFPSAALTSSSSSLTRHAAHVHEASSLSAQNSLSDAACLSQIHPQVPPPQNQISLQTHTQPSQASNQVLTPQMQTEARSSLPQSSLPHIQPSVLQTPFPQAQVPLLQPQSQYLPQSSHPAPEASPQTPLPVPAASVQPQTSVTYPHPSLASLSASQNQTETQFPPSQADSPAPATPQQPPLLSHHAHLPPPQQPIPGAVPLQQLSQLYRDPLYPGFPQGEKGDVAPTPPFASSKSGEDLPRDFGVLRFFFNLGVKAYTMPMFAPYMYLLPLQHAHTMQPSLPSRSPSPTPHYPPSNLPTRHPEAYPHPQYPPTSASQYDHQAPPSEAHHPGDPFHQAGYPVAEPPPHRMSCPSLPWQQHQMPPQRSYPVGYPAQNPSYPVPQALSQGYNPAQSPGHPLYPPGMPAYPPSSLGYQSSPAHEELQMSQGLMEQRQPANGDPASGQGPVRVPGPGPASNNRTVPGFALKEQGDGLIRTVLLVDPPLNDNPILVSNPGAKDVPVSITTIKTRSTPGSPSLYDMISKTSLQGENNSPRGYRGHQKLLNPTSAYAPLGALEPAQVGHLSNKSEPHSVGCSTEEDWEEQPGYKPTNFNHRGPRRGHRGGGGRGRGSYDSGRGGQRRRHGGEAGAGLANVYIYRGRGRERGY